MTIRGGWAWALVSVTVLSLGLNFFMGGIAFSKFRHGGGGGLFFLSAGLEDLPRGMRRAVATKLREHKQEFRASMDEVRQLRRDAVGMLLQPEPDYDKVRANFAQVRGKMGDVQQRAQDLILDLMRTMPAEEREKMLAGRRGE